MGGEEGSSAEMHIGAKEDGTTSKGMMKLLSPNSSTRNV